MNNFFDKCHIEYMPLDQNFSDYIIYDKIKMVKRKTWTTKLYKYTLFENYKWNSILVFLLFDNIENYKKWLKIKPKKTIITKIYKLTDKIQVNCVFGSYERFERVKYYEWSREVWLLKAEQLSITISN